ncbi:MAG: helix-turn-helix domain-containing protein [Cyanobacteriota bacterium]
MTKEKQIAPSEDFEPTMLSMLKDPELAAGVLNEALEEYIIDGHYDSFVGAIKMVLKAYNISEIARQTGISNKHLHRIISGESKPSFDLLAKIFKYLGYQFELKPIAEKSA